MKIRETENIGWTQCLIWLNMGRKWDKGEYLARDGYGEKVWEVKKYEKCEVVWRTVKQN